MEHFRLRPIHTHSMPRPCRAAKGLECVFPIWFTQCGRVWFTLAMPCPCHAPTMPFFSRPQHGRLSTAVLCCGLEKNGMVGAWHGHGMAHVIQTRPHCVNQMGKTHSKPLAARHDRGTTWARHAMCESALTVEFEFDWCLDGVTPAVFHRYVSVFSLVILTYIVFFHHRRHKNLAYDSVVK